MRLRVSVLRCLLRVGGLLLLVLVGLLVVVMVFPWRGPGFREAAIRRWSRSLLWIAGVRLVVHRLPGAPAPAQLRGSLLFLNHISWLDVFAIDALQPAAFVAKAEIARWPFLGTLVSRTGQLFLERGRRHAVHRAIAHITERLDQGGVVAVFPEGTTGSGRHLLPFHANLAQALIGTSHPLVPVGLRYCDAQGRHSEAVEFIGRTTLVQSVLRVTASRGLRCELTLLPALQATPGQTRHALTAQARQAISEALALPLEDTIPETLHGLTVAPRSGSRPTRSPYPAPEGPDGSVPPASTSGRTPS